ncbi:hypothetical protein LTR53_015805 [Teratosphaeriaceae sp. CCFEE 6253]|nr:hypothetical protein LTR53_015805 [Teratosphaeriaceae sp. CCFEE 6253]
MTTSTAAPRLVPLWWDDAAFFSMPLWLDGQHNIHDPATGPSLAAPSAWGAIAMNTSYIQPVATQMPDGEAYVDFPSGLLPWLAQVPSIKARFPFIENCWTVSGQGQPTVHVPVVQVTASSTNFVEMGAGITTSSTPTGTFSVASPIIQTSETALLTLTPGTTTSSDAPSTVVANSPQIPASDTALLTPTRVTSSDLGTSPTSMDNLQTQSITAPTAEAQSLQGSASPNAPNTGGLGTMTTSNNLGALLSAISSVAQQSEQDSGASANTGAGGDGSVLAQGSTADVQTQGSYTAISLATSATSVGTPAPAGYVVGSQTVTPGGSPVSREGTTYSAMPSGSGVLVIAAGTTNTVRTFGGPATTLSNGQVIPSTNSPTGSTQGVVIGSQTLPYSSVGTDAIVVGSATLTVGGPAATQGGQTLTLATQGGSTVLVVNGGSTMALPTVAAVATQVVTIGDQTFTAYAAPSSVLVIDGVTVRPGTPTAVAGATVNISGTNLIVDSASATSTEGLGGAIISGLGGYAPNELPCG